MTLTRRGRYALLFLTALVLSFGFNWFMAGKVMTWHGPVDIHTELTACVEEDGSGGDMPCYWDGSSRGNGQGSSYWIDEEGTQHLIQE